MIYKDIVTKREFEQNGQKKAKWFKVGTLKTLDNGKQFIELNMFPDTSFYVFEQKEKDAGAGAQEVNLEESPF